MDHFDDTGTVFSTKKWAVVFMETLTELQVRSGIYLYHPVEEEEKHFW